MQAERRAQQEEAERARRKQQRDKNESKAKMKVREAAAEGVLKLGGQGRYAACCKPQRSWQGYYLSQWRWHMFAPSCQPRLAVQ